jgi:hypothetical protein
MMHVAAPQSREPCKRAAVERVEELLDTLISPDQAREVEEGKCVA